jgi:D-xylono/L-arabinono-1,4-lactonase
MDLLRNLLERRMQPEMIADYPCACGENPLWHPLEKRLYWTDIPAGKLYWYDPATGKHQVALETPGDMIGGFTFQADGALLLFMGKGAIRLWHGGAVRTLRAGLEGEEESRFNDVMADPLGRVFCGTMASKKGKGSLYRLDTDGTITKVVEGVGCSNGMGFTPDRKRMYYTDSGTREITIFDYDQTSGALSNRQLFVKIPEGQGVPDGMTVDANGEVWGAQWDGWACRRYNAAGVEQQMIKFPAKKVSSVVFGGADYSDAYFTTAGGDKRADNGPHAGALYRIKGLTRGVPEFYSRLKV